MTSVLSVKETLAALEGGKRATTHNVLPIRFVDESGDVRLLFGTDPDGAACVLVSAPGASSKLPVFRTKVFSCEFAPAARVQLAGGEDTCAALVIRCIRAREFRDVLAALVDEVRSTLTADDPKLAWTEVGRLLARWADFFAEPESLTDASALGLWGELLVIDSATDVNAALAAWRGSEGATYDFFCNSFALEVKTGLRQGVHRVSHSQVSGSGVAGVLLSIAASEDPQGRSLPELEDSIVARLEQEGPYYEALRRRGVHPVSLRRFERRWALVQPPSVYKLEDVPRVLGVQPGVSELAYTIRLDASQKLDARAEKQAWDSLGLQFKWEI